MKRTINIALPVDASRDTSNKRNKQSVEITINVAVNDGSDNVAPVISTDSSLNFDAILAPASKNVFDFHKDTLSSNFLSSSGFGSSSGFNGFCGPFLSPFSFDSSSIAYDSQFIGFIHNSDVIMEHVYFFKCNNIDVMSFVNDTIVPIFGNNIKCCYVKCSDGTNIMDKLLEISQEKNYQSDDNIDLIPTCIERKFI